MDKALGKQDRPGTMEEVNRNFISIFISDQVMKKAAAAAGLEPNKVTIGKLHRSLVKQLGSEKALERFRCCASSRRTRSGKYCEIRC